MALIDYVVLVPILDEWREVIPILGAGRTLRRNSTPYHVCQVPVDAPPEAVGTYLVAAVRMGLWTPGQSQAGIVTKEALIAWRPSRLLLVGIAGSLEPDKILLGDVVVPDMVIGYEIGDAVGRDERTVRPTPHETNRLDLDGIISFRDDSAAYAAWQNACVRDATRLEIDLIRPPELHITWTASGNDVVRSMAAGRQLRELLKSPYVEAVEMEARGADRAVYSEPNHPDVLMIRGISDYADEHKQKLDETARGGWRRYAAANAARLLAAYLSRGPVAPISPALTLDATVGGLGRFFAADVPQELDVERPGQQFAAFPQLLRRSGSTPDLSMTVTAAMSDGTASAAGRGVVMIDDRTSGHRRTIWGTPESNGRLRFEVPDNEGGYDLELLLVYPATVAQLTIVCADAFRRTATSTIDFSVL